MPSSTRFLSWLIAIPCATVFGTSVVAADPPTSTALRLPGIFGDNMVLQAEKPAHVWGWAPPGQIVRVSIGNQKKNATTETDGKWELQLDPFKPGEHLEMTVEGGARITVKNILAGEVWLCSGQSNMELRLSQAARAAEEIKEAVYPDLRIFTTKVHAPEKPDEDCKGEWVVCSPQTAGQFSAVGYFFGRRLHQNLKVPVGLIVSAVGATPAENWVRYDVLRSDPILEPIADRFDKTPKDPKGWDVQLPTGLYNGEIAPLNRFPLRGVIWYQGETNVKRACQYRVLFPSLIQDWRKVRGENFPFYFVQLANCGQPSQQPGESDWAELREAQSLALKLPNTGMAVAIDVGEAATIHPKNKQDVGARLALLALAKTYGQKQVCSGPLYKSMKAEGGKIRIAFDETGGALEAKGGILKGFAIAGADRKFVWANAAIDGQTVVVSSPQVPAPAAVRYGWANNPDGCNLYNKEGLPASPFRTDVWPGITENAK